MLGDREGRQVDVEPQPVLGKVMAQSSTFSPKQGFTSMSQLIDGSTGKGVQGACHGGLLGESLLSPGASQGDVGSEAGIDLGDGATTGQNADQKLRQLVWRRVVHLFQPQLQVCPQRCQELGASQAVAQEA